MRRISRSALVPYSADEMYALVEDVEAYPEFLPWCSGARLYRTGDTAVEASLSLRRAGVEKTFRTRNTLTPGEHIHMQLVDGPFRELHGDWRFLQLGDEGSKVSLDLAFAFASTFLDGLLGRYLEESCNSLVDAFAERARQTYG